MSAAAEAAAPPAKGKKKLVIIIAAAVLALGVAGGGAAMMMKKKVDPDAEGVEEHGGSAKGAQASAAKHDPKAVPVFVSLDPFTVNLADRNAERFAQIGVTLEIEDAHLSDQIKAYMPAIRNNILMTIADRTAGELMGREGKAKLAERIRRSASRALGAEVEELEEQEPEATADADAETPKAKKKKKKKPVELALPIKAVHFSNIIIQ